MIVLTHTAAIRQVAHPMIQKQKDFRVQPHAEKEEVVVEV
jgi:hypothetical protein